MAVMRSRLRAHAVEWHVAPAAHIDSLHRSSFLELQRRCNHELCRHHALTHNVWLDALEAARMPPTPERLLAALQQLSRFLGALSRVRGQHARLLQGGCGHEEGDCGTAVVICFDENGVPWCPPLPGMGMGDSRVMSERLQSWSNAWHQAVGQAPAAAAPLADTDSLCTLIERDYNSPRLSVSLGVMMALENAISTDFWQRLGRGLHQCCEALGLKFADAGFFPVAETHARLQARHVLYLVEGASVHDLLDESVFFEAGLAALACLDRFWAALAEGMAEPLPH